MTTVVITASTANLLFGQTKISSLFRGSYFVLLTFYKQKNKTKRFIVFTNKPAPFSGALATIVTGTLQPVG